MKRWLLGSPVTSRATRTRTRARARTVRQARAHRLSISSAATATIPKSSKSECTQGTVVNDTAYQNIVMKYKGIQSPPLIADLERQRATELVDGLLGITQDLMLLRDDDQDCHLELENSNDIVHHTIAYSGGVDSSLVAALVHNVLTANKSSSIFKHHSVQAVMGVSPAVPEEQIELARHVAETIGISFFTTPTNEGSREMYMANQGKACLACKTELYSTLQAVQRHLLTMRLRNQSMNTNKTTNSSLLIKLYNGTNADDTRDPTRLGLVAAQQFAVYSPLHLTTKQDVRIAARHLGLPNWQNAASPCLRSRLAIGVAATKQHLQRIAVAEQFVQHQLRSLIDETTNLRVRQLVQQQACLEIDERFLESVQELYLKQRSEWDHYFLEKLQFASFRMRPFRSGSVAKEAPPDQPQSDVQ